MGSRKKPPKPETSHTSEATSVPPRPFPEWRAEPFERDEDAAYAFGHHLIVDCRDEALKVIPTSATAAARASAVEAVDTALHNMCDMLEGFWRLTIDAT
ncbi:MAG TPA: hypothetical protein VIV11_23025, partial [Kofleriaceae bacterium]